LRDAIDLSSASDEFYSVAVFCQLSFDKSSSAARLIMRHGDFLPGYGKYFSRFLDAVPDVLLHATRRMNNELTSSCLAEICNDADFNANLHPPLLESQICVPPGYVAQELREIECRDLMVRRSRSGDGLDLLDAQTERVVFPVDLGFQTALARPALVQFLARFSPTYAFNPPLPDLHSNHDSANTRSVECRPRITLEGQVVLARRRWSVPEELLPSSGRNESAADYFLRVNLWRQKLGLPVSVYAKVRNPPSGVRMADAGSDAEGQIQDDADVMRQNDKELTPHVGKEQLPAESVAPQDRSRERHGSRDSWKPQFIAFDGSPV
jgi:hypothetical protein